MLNKQHSWGSCSVNKQYSWGSCSVNKQYSWGSCSVNKQYSWGSYSVHKQHSWGSCSVNKQYSCSVNKQYSRGSCSTRVHHALQKIEPQTFCSFSHCRLIRATCCWWLPLASDNSLAYAASKSAFVAFHLSAHVFCLHHNSCTR